MSSRSRLIEHAKSVILVVLFIATILLLYLLWGKDYLRPAAVTVLRGQAAEVNESLLVVPDYVAYGSGDGSFSLADDPAEAFAKAVAQAAGFAKLSSPTLSQITREQYRAAMTGFESVQLSFRYALPTAQFCEYYGLGKFTSSDSSESFTCFGFSEASPESIFFKDESSGSCYRLLFGEAPASLSYRFTDAGSAQYYYCGDILGGKADAMIALEGESTLQAGRMLTELEADPMLSTEIARAAYGDTFDFVRRLRDGFGTLTYMYGYGAKVLTCYTDGSFDYYDESTGRGESRGFFGDLKTAADFVEKCGGIPKDENGGLAMQLFGAIRLDQGRSSGYVFGFVQTEDGVPVLSDRGCSVEVEVSGGQVTRMKRAVIKASDISGDSREVMQPANVLAGNCNHIYNISTNSMLSVEPAEAYAYVADNVRSMRMGLYEQEDLGTLTPCWIVLSPAARFFFDLYDGTPLGFDLIGD